MRAIDVSPMPSSPNSRTATARISSVGSPFATRGRRRGRPMVRGAAGRWLFTERSGADRKHGRSVARARRVTMARNVFPEDEFDGEGLRRQDAAWKLTLV